MTYLDCFVGESASHGPEIEQRRTQLLERVRLHIPEGPDIDKLLASGHSQIELSRVKVLDPRPRIEEPGEIEVQPVLPIGWIDDGSGFKSVPGIERLVLLGTTPSGEVRPLGNMTIPTDDYETPELAIVAGTQKDAGPTDWQSADAELWLTIAEAALWAQP